MSLREHKSVADAPGQVNLSGNARPRGLEPDPAPSPARKTDLKKPLPLCATAQTR